MKEIILGNHIRKVPSVAVGCMRLSEKSKDEMNRFIHAALEQGAYLFDHADIKKYTSPLHKFILF